MTQMTTIMSVIITSILSCFFSTAQAMDNNITNRTKFFSIHIGATRVIYDMASSGATLAITNKHEFPILVQSDVLSEDKEMSTHFIITPPLFRLDPLQSTRLRIVRTGGNFPIDRESMQWICVKGIPPKEDSKWGGTDAENKDKKMTLNVQLSVNSCIKMFIRPSNVKGHPDDVAGKVKWQITGNKLKGINPTPFYINLAELRVGKKEITEPHYIEPFSSYEYQIPTNGAKKVEWKIITDYGGVGKNFEEFLD